MKYDKDQALRRSKYVWFQHFFGPVAVPTAFLTVGVNQVVRNPTLRIALTLASLAVGARLYLNEFRSFDMNTEKTYKVLLCPTHIGKECRDM